MKKIILYNIITFANGIANISLYIGVAILILKGNPTVAIILLILGTLGIIFIPNEEHLKKIIFGSGQLKVNDIGIMKYSELQEHLSENIEELGDIKIMYLMGPATKDNIQKSKDLYFNN